MYLIQCTGHLFASAIIAIHFPSSLQSGCRQSIGWKLSGFVIYLAICVQEGVGLLLKHSGYAAGM